MEIIFDIDGTLIDSFMASGVEYKKALLEVLPEAQIRPAWRDYSNVTDSGLIMEVLTDNDYDLPVAETIQQIKETFMRNTSQTLAETPCGLIAGAQEFFNACKERYKVGIATGCWLEAAEVKLQTAGFNWGETFISSSDGHHTREGILEHGRKSIGAEDVIYFGDAIWDVKTTSNLGWKFIGIGEKLRGECKHWFPDYISPEEIFKIMEGM